MKNSVDVDKILSEGITITSSGSSGKPKPFFQSPEKIKAANEAARKTQGITNESRIYTFMKTAYAGGLLVQTLPAYEIGAHVTLDSFNAFEFARKVKDHTHTAMGPVHAKLIMKTKGFDTLDLSGITVICGSEPVTWDIIEAFVSRGAKVIVIWGMTEIGPVAMYHEFNSIEEVHKVKSICPPNATILGSNKNCEYKVEDGELVVRGDICIFDDWYHTKDTVVEIDEYLFYTGRTNMEVDFDNPKKGLPMPLNPCASA